MLLAFAYSFKMERLDAYHQVHTTAKQLEDLGTLALMSYRDTDDRQRRKFQRYILLM